MLIKIGPTLVVLVRGFNQVRVRVAEGSGRGHFCVSVMGGHGLTGHKGSVILYHLLPDILPSCPQRVRQGLDIVIK